MTRARLEAAAVVVALAAMALFCRARFAMTTEITHFLPAGSDVRLVGYTRALADSELTRAMILSVEAPDRKTAAAAAGELGALLKDDPRVAWVRASPEVDDAGGKAVYDAYFPRRLMLLSERPEAELPARLSDAGLADAAREVKRRLASPAGPLVARLAGADPLLAFPALLARLQTLQGDSVGTEGGHFVSRDGHGIVFLASKASAFQSDAQAPLLAAIARDFATVNAAHGGALRLEQSGVNRFAVDAEASIKDDISRISLLGTLGSILLLLVVFRAPAYLVLLMLPVGAGMLGGLFACLALFGRIHGMTLAFGSALIGVVIDYPIHFFNNYTLRPDPDGAAGSLRRIWMSVFLGAVTTCAGFAGMAWTSFPGIREIAVFAPAGVLAALAVTRWLLPPLMPRSRPPARAQVRLAEWLARTLERLRASPRLLVALPAAALVVCALGLPRVRWVDDLGALNHRDPAMVAEDDRVRERVSTLDAGRFVVAAGADLEAALRVNDAAHAVLSQARADGLLETFRSLHEALWSADLQRRNLAAVKASPDLAARASRAFESEGFKPGALAPFAAALSETPAPVTFADLAATPLALALKPFRLALPNGDVAILTLVQGVKDAAALSARLAAVPGVDFFDQSTFLRELYGRFRARTEELILAGLAAVFAIVLWCYRRLRPSLAAFLPSVLAAVTATALLGLCGFELNLMNLIGGLIVLSVGVDYGIFLVETHRRKDALATSLLSVVLACGMTVLSFGLLGLSQNPALRAVGLTTGLGCVLALVLSPAALFLLEEKPA